MSYTVTATKMRPAVFDQLAGQDFVATSLKKSVESGKIAHAYLFSGPRGVGKTSAARILARAINCQDRKDGNPCCQCSSCREIAQGSSMDVIEIDGASNTSVNDVRQIKDEVLFAPVNSKYKVYIIDEVHMLSNSAFNALLKTIEEPPPYIVFIFATTEVHKVPATIRSRCQHFNFRLIHTDVIRDLLRNVCDKNGIKADDDVLFWVAKEATGSLRDAYTLFDKVAAFAGDDPMTLDLIKEKMGLAGFDKINELAECFADMDGNKALEILDGIIGSGVAAEQFVTELTEYLRNVLLIKNSVTKETVLGYSAGSFSKKVVDAFSVFQLEQALALTLQLYRDMRYSISQRFELELLVTRLAGMKNFISRQELLDKIQKLKAGFIPVQDNGADNSDAAVPEVEEVQPDRSSMEKSSAAAMDMASLRDAVIESVKKNGNNIMLLSALGKTFDWQEDGGMIYIPCEDSLFISKLRENIQWLTSEVHNISGKDYRVEIKPLQKKSQIEDNISAEMDSRVEMVQKIFKGEIVEKKRVR